MRADVERPDPSTLLLASDASLPAQSKKNDHHFRRSGTVWWAWEDLNLRPHPERRIPLSCGQGFEGDVVAQGLELGNGSLASAVGVAADEVVATQVLVVAVVGE
jgi:hypothetical protein